MPEAIFIHDGASIDYRPAVDVADGEVVVQGDLVGIAKTNIRANHIGALAIRGVFDVVKATGPAKAIDMGELVYWNNMTRVATTVSGPHKKLGKCVRAASNDDATVRVRLSQ